jgi:hypothetical protein
MTNELIELLDQRYGNPHAKDCALIQRGIAELRRLQAENEQLKAKLNESK